MAEPFDVRARRGRAPGDAWGRSLDESLRQQGATHVPAAYGRAHKLDGEEAMCELRHLLGFEPVNAAWQLRVHQTGSSM